MLAKRPRSVDGNSELPDGLGEEPRPPHEPAAAHSPGALPTPRIAGLSLRAEQLLIGISVFRQPADSNALVFQLGEHDWAAARAPDRHGPVPPYLPPADLPELLAACVASELVHSTGPHDGPATSWQADPWLAAEVHQQLSAAGRQAEIIAAHRRAAEYWQWRGAAWPQDRRADLHDLLEARYHLFRAGDAEQGSDVTQMVCAQLRAWGDLGREAELIQSTLDLLPTRSASRANWMHELGVIYQVRGEHGDAYRCYAGAVQMFAILGDFAVVARGQHSLGALAQARGDYRRAERHYKRSTAAERRAGGAVQAPPPPALGSAPAPEPAPAPNLDPPDDRRLAGSTAPAGGRRPAADVLRTASTVSAGDALRADDTMLGRDGAQPGNTVPAVNTVPGDKPLASDTSADDSPPALDCAQAGGSEPAAPGPASKTAAAVAGLTPGAVFKPSVPRLEPIMPAARSVADATQATRPTAEPAAVTAEPATATAEATRPAAEPAAVTAESTRPAAEPIRVTDGLPPAIATPPGPDPDGRPATPDATGSALRRAGRVLNRRSVLLPSVLAVGLTALTAVGLSAALARTASPQSGPSPATAAARARASAASWVAAQVSRSAVVACDPALCSVLLQRGVPAGDLLALGPGGPADPLASDVIVATAAVREEFGARLAAVYAPDVVASFGAGTAAIQVRVIAPDGAGAYRRAASAEVLVRRRFGAELLRNSHLIVSPPARSELAAGRVDARLLATLATLADIESLRVLQFADAGPGASADVPLRAAEVVADPKTAVAGWMSVALRFLAAQQAPFRPTVTAIAQLAPAGRALLIEYPSPSPLGLLTASGSPPGA